jgi:Na+-translocating ferredoxin:NAD+ oxidoreductase RNF subunit RnfB
MIENILYPIITIGGLSLVFGALLGFSAKRFAVNVDPKVKQIVNILPGVNCGGCGFAGCAVFAEAVASEKASYQGCPAGGSAAALKIAETMGIEAEVSNRKVAFIKCHGLDSNVKRNYIYDGPKSCVAASQLAAGGNKACAYSCIGLASCKNACPFGAINIIDSIAEVDIIKCTACGKCVSVCPKNLIDIVPEKNAVRVFCNSKDIGRVVRRNCRAGCIGCGICVKVCKSDAITIVDNIACVDYTKCTSCKACVDKCPSKSIMVMH